MQSSCKAPPTMVSASLPASPSSISKFIADNQTLSMLETQCTNMRDLHQLHAQLIKTDLAADTIAASRLLAFCVSSPSGDLNYAELLFYHTKHQNAFMYNTLIRAFSKSSTPHKSISLFNELLHSSVQPQRLTFPSLFVSYAQLDLSHEGNQLHGMVLKLGYATDAFIRNSMISMYAADGNVAAASQLFADCSRRVDHIDIVAWNSIIMGFAKAGLVDKSRSLFDEMPERNEVTWSSMISGYVRNGRNKEALDLFHLMQDSGLKPNVHILASLLNACASLGALEQGVWIHDYLVKNGSELNHIVTTAVIHMYCKCGNIDQAVDVFENSRIRGLSSWNSLISGLAMHGRGRQALSYFAALESSGNLKPDSVTFLGVLTSCCHSGMVDEALKYFSLMVDTYKIKPQIEHYTCVVDALGRAGLIEEAKGLILRMPVELDITIWASLLSSCRIHRNTSTAKLAAEKILELDPGDTGAYVLLSDMYRIDGEFRDSIRTRAMMKEKGARKEPGCSLIEVDCVSHEFIAGGVLHPRASEIYQLLNNLALNLMEEFH